MFWSVSHDKLGTVLIIFSLLSVSLWVSSETSGLVDKSVVISEKVISDRKPYILSTLCQDKSHRDIVLTNVFKTLLKIKIGHMCRKKIERMKSQIRHIHKKMPILKHE